MEQLSRQTVRYIEDGRPQYYLQKLLELKALFQRENKNLEVAKKHKPGLIGYGPVFMVAMLKDALDMTGILALPPMSAITSGCFGIVIFFLLVLARSNYSLITSRALLMFTMKRRIFRRFFSLIILMLAFITEGFFFGINFFPIQTMSILVIFLMDRYLSNKQIEEILNLIKLLEGEYATTARRALAYRPRRPVVTVTDESDGSEQRMRLRGSGNYQPLGQLSQAA